MHLAIVRNSHMGLERLVVDRDLVSGLDRDMVALVRRRAHGSVPLMRPGGWECPGAPQYICSVVCWLPCLRRERFGHRQY